MIHTHYRHYVSCVPVLRLNPLDMLWYEIRIFCCIDSIYTHSLPRDRLDERLNSCCQRYNKTLSQRKPGIRYMDRKVHKHPWVLSSCWGWISFFPFKMRQLLLALTVAHCEYHNRRGDKVHPCQRHMPTLNIQQCRHSCHSECTGTKWIMAATLVAYTATTPPTGDLQEQFEIHRTHVDSGAKVLWPWLCKCKCCLARRAVDASSEKRPSHT